MGQLVNFCAGTNKAILPAEKVEAILYNIIDNGIDEKVRQYTREMFEFAGTEIPFQDSSGFQIFIAESKGKIVNSEPTHPLKLDEKEINIAPWHVIEVARELNPKIITSLDYPLRPKTSEKGQEYEFIQKMDINIKWAKETAELREKYCPDTKLLVPLQAYNVEQMEIILNELSGVNYDGVALIARALDTKQLTLCLCRLYQLGIQEVHMLGVSEFFKIGLFAYMARKHFDWISFDATTWREVAQGAGFMSSYDLSVKKIGGVRIDETIKNTCPCPWCRGTTFTQIKNMPQTDQIAFLRCHNFWVIDQAAKELYNNSDSVSALERHLLGRTDKTGRVKALCYALDLFELFKDGDINDLKALLQ